MLLQIQGICLSVEPVYLYICIFYERKSVIVQ